MTFTEGVPASSYLTDLAGQSKNCIPRSIEELFDRIFNDLSVEESHRKVELAKSNLKALKDYPKESLSADQKLSCQIASLQLNRIIEREDGVALSNKDVYYVYLLKEHTTLDLFPEKVHETGCQEVERIEKKIIELLKQQGLWNQEVSIGAHLKQLNKPGFITERQLFLILDRAEKKLGPLFSAKPKTLPNIQLGWYPEAKWGVGYQPPDIDGSRPGTICVNADPQWLLSSQIETAAVHEGIPGHHYQRSLQMESGNHKLRKSFEYAAYVEGWALYAEMLAYEEGFYSSPFYQIVHLQSELWRAARLVIDTGIHWKRWSREEAIAYMAHVTGLPDPIVIADIEKCFDTPGKACAYKIGQMKILEIREEEKKRLGDQFDLKEFHGRILNRGVIPLSML
ncbi:MAG TPA: DUF885 domain-containing protein [Chlamydiales bacterium]|nr:DUF885 domain-containing protein [Chlamydiales bacterium]